MCAQVSEDKSKKKKTMETSIWKKHLPEILVLVYTMHTYIYVNTMLFYALSIMAAEIKFSTLLLSFLVEVLFLFQRSLIPLAIQKWHLHKMLKLA